MILNKDQYFQAFQKFYPHVGINSEVSPTQFYEMLNNMSMSNYSIPYDQETFNELIQRVQQFGVSLTINNYLDVHLQAVEILNLRVESLRSQVKSIDSFLNQLQGKITELNNSRTQGMNHQINFKTFTLTGQIPNQPLLLRISSESFQNDNVLQFSQQGGHLVVNYPNNRFEIQNLKQNFSLEVIDQNYQSYGQTYLCVFQLNITYGGKVSLPLTFDNLGTRLTLEVEGFVDITHPQYAQEDQLVLREEQALINSDLAGISDQLKDLNSPFEGAQQRSFRQPSHNPSFYNQPQQAGYSGGMGGQNNISPPIYQDEGYETAYGMQQKQVNVQGGMKDNHMYTSNNEECDFNSKSLVTNMHYLLMVYIVISVLFCVKRSMFLDVTIGICFLAIIYRFDLSSYPRNTEFLKLFIGLFVVSASLDLAWLIVFFPSWNRDVSSEDKGVQGVLRIIILGASLLFMIYKVLMIVAVVFLNKDLQNHGFHTHRNVEDFLSGADFKSRTSHQITNSKQIH